MHEFSSHSVACEGTRHRHGRNIGWDHMPPPRRETRLPRVSHVSVPDWSQHNIGMLVREDMDEIRGS